MIHSQLKKIQDWVRQFMHINAVTVGGVRFNDWHTKDATREVQGAQVTCRSMWTQKHVTDR